jgi:hypothetical protein
VLAAVPAVVVGCPRDSVGPCRGTVRIREGARTLGGGSFHVKHGKLGAVRIKLPADVVRRLEESGFGVNVVLRASRGRVHRTVTVPQLLPGL